MKRRRSLFVHFSHIRLLAQKFALVILFLSAFVLMLVNKTDTVIIEKTSTVATDVISPVIDVLVIPAKAIASVYDYFKDLKEIHNDNQRLKDENKQLTNLYDRTRALEIENRLLSDLLNYVTPPEAEFMTARVIAEEGDAFSHSVIAYVGDKPVKKGQVALSDKGVVGRVDRVGNVYAKIILITDINSKIPVVSQKSRDRGILAGNNGRELSLIFTPLLAELHKGDLLVTSGIGGGLPPDIPVARIKRAGVDNITAVPLFTPSDIEVVKIIAYDVLPDPETAKELE